MLRSPSAGMFYVFCDEKHLRQENAISVGVVMVPQQSWSCLNFQLQCLMAPKKANRIDRLRNVLESVDGIALVAWTGVAGIDQPGKCDSTADINGMARSDNIWGISMATAVYRTLILARTFSLEVRTADIHYDTYSLRQDHRTALYDSLRERIPKDIHKARTDGHAPSDFRPRIRRIEDTPKALVGDAPTKFQSGVKAAHYLLQRTMQLRSDSSNGRIRFLDNTPIVRDFIGKF